MGFILALDQGTTGTTAALVDAKTFKFIDKVNQEYPQIYPKPGWVEHNLNDIWTSVESTVKKLLQKTNIPSSSIISIGITNQRETTCAFDRSGNPLANAIVWQDRRTSDFCLQNKSKEPMLRSKTGLPLDPYFSATKMRWLLKNSDAVKTAAKNKELFFGTIDTFLLFKLTGIHATEGSNASRTLLYNLHDLKWDDELLSFFEIPAETLPKVLPSFGNFGSTTSLSFLPDNIPVTGILGDQQSALFGQAGHSKGALKCTYGTGAFMLLNTGTTPVHSNNGLLTTIAYQDQKGNAHYALEGSCYIAGAAVQWMRDNLKLISSSPEIETLAKQIGSLEEMEHILFMPFFTGIGSPHWAADAKAAIIGMTRDTGAAHLARACLEGIALSINDLVNAMSADTKIKVSTMRVDGGASANDLLLELQATFGEMQVVRPKVIETTAYGAALAAGLGLGIVTFETIDKLWEEDRVFNSIESQVSYCKMKNALWQNSIKKLFL
ncbi:MAG: glycerol kinase [Bdellovibrionales bacterium CG12_big_fil_rev_8_21_14_0_65_38_15]|nr:MAG: glycerol kinase [Bdellovibrionales bacterium CG22_combo_CG10-13_8_21_14_all_38_13]PIQ55944.1 MAG: glycerol kinase [Bdellovibrionales bacterium CG12_big_fil_rev_8_21_14_0_65_38_15]PIR29578.1 MAG: glycerol kinase [Bdellovibrionales bacterium CG11_big_fil_rev_8_21_14_0_20_38_13]